MASKPKKPPPKAAHKQATLAFNGALVIRDPDPTGSGRARSNSPPLPLEELHGSEGGDCHSPSSAGWSDSTSSILSSAEAYARKTDSVKGPYNVKVLLSLRVVGGGCGVVASSINLKRVLLTVPNLSNKRRKYGKDDKMKILETAATHVKHL